MIKNKNRYIEYAILIIGSLIIICIPIILYCLLRYNLKWGLKSFIETYMAYFGTVSLGIVALYQNVRLNKENRKIRNVEKTQFLSFVKCSFDMNVPAETDFYGLSSILFEDENRESAIYLSGKIKNVSKYPIQKLHGEIFRNGKKIGQKEFYESNNFYLESGEETYIMVLIYLLENTPDIISSSNTSKFNYCEEKFDYLIKDRVNIILTFTNVFGYTTYNGTIN